MKDIDPAPFSKHFKNRGNFKIVPRPSDAHNREETGK